MEARDFPITPPGKFATFVPTLVGFGCLLILVAVHALAHSSAEEWMRSWPVLLAALVLPLVTWHMRHRSVRLGDQGLRIRTFPWPRTLPIASIDLAQAQIVDLEKRPELQPSIKLAGSRMPGYRAGRFRLRDGRWASVLITDPHRVLLLPLRDCGLVMLSVQRGEALLEAMRRRG